MKKILSRGLLVFALFLLTGGCTYSYYADEHQITGNHINMGVWNSGRATISEVLYNPAGADAGKEWIDIVNTGGLPLDMAGYVIHFNTVGSNHFTFPSLTLGVNSRVRVHLRSSGANTASDLYWPATGGKNMGNVNGSIALFKSMPKGISTIVDFVQYGAPSQDNEAKAVVAGIWTNNAVVPNVAENHSTRLINNLDHNLISDWEDNPTPL